MTYLINFILYHVTKSNGKQPPASTSYPKPAGHAYNVAVRDPSSQIATTEQSGSIERTSPTRQVAIERFRNFYICYRFLFFFTFL